MEPANLNMPSEREDEIEALLRTAQPPLADDGFSTRVLAALPTTAPRESGRWWWATAGGVAGAAVAITRGFSLGALRDSALDFQSSLAALAPVVDNAWVALAVLISVGALIYAHWPAIHKRFPL